MGLVLEILLIVGLMIGLIINLIAQSANKSANKLISKLVIKRITNELITRQDRSPRNRINGCAAPRTHPPQQHRQPDRPP